MKLVDRRVLRGDGIMQRWQKNVRQKNEAFRLIHNGFGWRLNAFLLSGVAGHSAADFLNCHFLLKSVCGQWLTPDLPKVNSISAGITERETGISSGRFFWFIIGLSEVADGAY